MNEFFFVKRFSEKFYHCSFLHKIVVLNVKKLAKYFLLVIKKLIIILCKNMDFDNKVNNKTLQTSDINDLISGYREFYSDYRANNNELLNLYEKLVKQGQSPKTMFVSCSDSRIDPSTTTKAKPGDIFAVRNVANLIPPYQEDSTTFHGVSSAIEFGVKGLNIPDIIIMGHSHCGGVKAIVQKVANNILNETNKNEFSFVLSWMKIAKKRVEEILADKMDLYKSNPDEVENFCAMELIKLSMQNLLSFPFIKQAVLEGKLKIHGWYFDIANVMIVNYDQKSNSFLPL